MPAYRNVAMSDLPGCGCRDSLRSSGLAPGRLRSASAKPDRDVGCGDRCPVDLHKEREGGHSVTFPDSDEAFTDGDTVAETVAEAADCLAEALAGRIARRADIPAPSPARGRPAATPGAVLAAKTALYEALREERLSNSAFAAAMGVQESEVRRMLDPRHATEIGRLEEALARFGKRLVVTVEAAA